MLDHVYTKLIDADDLPSASTMFGNEEIFETKALKECNPPSEAQTSNITYECSDRKKSLRILDPELVTNHSPNKKIRSMPDQSLRTVKCKLTNTHKQNQPWWLAICDHSTWIR